jgi:membrane protein YdbS with pleckstrin-like domain
MSKIDEKKEYITTLRVYLGFILAIVLSIGTGLTKVYLSNSIGLIFYLGVFLILISILVFVKINKKLHTEIKGLRNL